MAASLALASCQPAGVEGSRSLVGADRLPSSSALSREIVQINRGYGEVSTGFLSYELRPDDTLAVTHTDRARDKVLGEERFRLAPGVAHKARRLLWRLRPATLEGVDAHEARPSGCRRRGPHDFGELAVVFIDEGGSPGVEDDRVGTFELPVPESCGTPQAREARQVMSQVMGSFPESRVAAGFEQR
jgi:hypothetical protein